MIFYCFFFYFIFCLFWKNSKPIRSRVRGSTEHRNLSALPSRSALGCASGTTLGQRAQVSMLGRTSDAASNINIGSEVYCANGLLAFILFPHRQRDFQSGAMRAWAQGQFWHDHKRKASNKKKKPARRRRVVRRQRNTQWLALRKITAKGRENTQRKLSNELCASRTTKRVVLLKFYAKYIWRVLHEGAEGWKVSMRSERERERHGERERERERETWRERERERHGEREREMRERDKEREKRHGGLMGRMWGKLKKIAVQFVWGGKKGIQ